MIKWWMVKWVIILGVIGITNGCSFYKGITLSEEYRRPVRTAMEFTDKVYKALGGKNGN